MRSRGLCRQHRRLVVASVSILCGLLGLPTRPRVRRSGAAPRCGEHLAAKYVKWHLRRPARHLEGSRRRASARDIGAAGRATSRQTSSDTVAVAEAVWVQVPADAGGLRLFVCELRNREPLKMLRSAGTVLTGSIDRSRDSMGRPPRPGAVPAGGPCRSDGGFRHPPVRPNGTPNCACCQPYRVHPLPLSNASKA